MNKKLKAKNKSIQFCYKNKLNFTKKLNKNKKETNNSIRTFLVNLLIQLQGKVHKISTLTN